MNRKWLLVILLILLVAWISRMELISWFQYQRLRSLQCTNYDQPDPCFAKLWVHRVNSLERFNLVKDRFKGCEADVVFDSTDNSFLVYHPPSDYKQLKLEQLLQVALGNQKKLWLDTRGVDSLCMRKAFEKLEVMNQGLNFKGAVIFELYDLKAANYFAAGGYQVSLNIPPAYLQENADLQSFCRQLSPGVKFISQESKYVNRLKKAVPGKKILTWSLSFNNYFHSAAYLFIIPVIFFVSLFPLR